MTQTTPHEQLTQAGKAIFEAYAKITRQVIAAVKTPAFQSLLRQSNDHEFITRVANRERAIHAEWWEAHLDKVYADLGLTRPVKKD